MLEIGSIVDGKYKILNKIGQGGMSIVYLAMNERANKQWAIKEVRKDGVKDFEVVKQGLIVEIDMLKRLSHPNLPSIIDVIDQKDNFLIVMDYIQGNSLKNKLDEFGAQSQELVIEWAKQLSDVLGYLHTRKPAIIYRDMKPSNIMLKPDGKLTLIDFGTAREYKEKNLADTTCLGTIGYAAPEQFGGKGQTDGRTDIYCLGATLYHLVTGMNPSEPPYEIKPIREINSSLSSGLEKIILKCTQRNPEDRYQNCAELTYALEHYEEIDDIFRKRQKKKLAIFIMTVFFAIVSLGAGIGFGKAAEAKTDEQYEDVIAEANSLTNEDSIRETLKKAISIKPGDKEAYINLIESYYNPQYGDENDIYNFSVDEAQEIEEILNDFGSDLKENKSNYVEVSYELAKAYFFYYTYGNEDKSGDNENAKYKAAKKWYRNVIDYSDENIFLYWNESKIYYEISEYYTSIGDWENTGDFKGKYIEYFNNYLQLFTLASDNKKINNDNIKLRMYQLFSSAIAAKTEKFINDGVLIEDIRNLLHQMQTEINSIENPDSNLESLISSININNKKIEIKLQAMSGS
ncbi:MAG: serine/threonine protein kinase [Lachnospiraceae bacterium]|nr:serine/threonine protein kinase [Lachnospiraceae bacterium]